MNSLIKVVRILVPFVSGLVVFALGYLISASIYDSITEINDVRYITRIMLLDDDWLIYDYVDKSNYFLYVPTILFFYVAVAITNRFMFDNAYSHIQMQLVRLGSMKRWVIRQLKTIVTDNVLYFAGFMVGGMCVSTIKIDVWYVLTIGLRFIWNLIFSCLIIYMLRKKKISTGVFVVIIISVILVIIDIPVAHISLISYSDRLGSIVAGYAVAVMLFAVVIASAVHRIKRDEVM